MKMTWIPIDPEGKYGPENGASSWVFVPECEECVEGLICGGPSTSVEVAPGYFAEAPGEYTGPLVSCCAAGRRGSDSLVCGKDDIPACPGGAYETCAEHHSGPLCANCDEGYYWYGGLCTSCTRGLTLFIIFVLGLVGGICVMCYFLGLIALRKPLTTPKSIGCWKLKRELKKERTVNSRMLFKFSGDLLLLLQVGAALDQVSEFFDILLLDTQIMGLSCVLGEGQTAHGWFSFPLFPMFIAAISVVCTLGLRRLGYIEKDSPSVLSVLLCVACAFHLPFWHSFTSVYKCVEHPSAEASMVYRPMISCVKAQASSYGIAVFLMIGVLLIFAYLGYQAKDLPEDSSFVGHLIEDRMLFLTARFPREKSWFLLVALSRNIGFVFFPQMFKDNATMQFIGSAVCVAIYVVVAVYKKPYAKYRPVSAKGESEPVAGAGQSGSEKVGDAERAEATPQAEAQSEGISGLAKLDHVTSIALIVVAFGQLLDTWWQPFLFFVLLVPWAAIGLRLLYKTPADDVLIPKGTPGRVEKAVTKVGKAVKDKLRDSGKQLARKFSRGADPRTSERLVTVRSGSKDSLAASDARSEAAVARSTAAVA